MLHTKLNTKDVAHMTGTGINRRFRENDGRFFIAERWALLELTSTLYDVVQLTQSDPRVRDLLAERPLVSAICESVLLSNDPQEGIVHAIKKGGDILVIDPRVRDHS